MKKKSSINKIVVPILNDEYKVVVCWGVPDAIKKVLHSYGHKPADGMTDWDKNRGICYYSKNCHPVIALPCFPKTPQEIATLAHESVHAVVNIFSKIEEELIGGEVFCHSVGAIVRGVLSK